MKSLSVSIFQKMIFGLLFTNEMISKLILRARLQLIDLEKLNEFYSLSKRYFTFTAWKFWLMIWRFEIYLSLTIYRSKWLISINALCCRWTSISTRSVITTWLLKSIFFILTALSTQLWSDNDTNVIFLCANEFDHCFVIFQTLIVSFVKMSYENAGWQSTQAWSSFIATHTRV